MIADEKIANATTESPRSIGSLDLTPAFAAQYIERSVSYDEHPQSSAAERASMIRVIFDFIFLCFIVDLLITFV